MSTFPGSSGYPPLPSTGQLQQPTMIYPAVANGRVGMYPPPQTAPQMVAPPASRSVGGTSVGQPLFGRGDTMESLQMNSVFYGGQPLNLETKEKLVEVPEVQIVEKIVEVVQKIQQEKIVHVPKVEVVERKIQIAKPVYKDKIVEVPQIQYREVPVERIVEVPEVQTHVVTKEVEVPQVVDVPIIQPRKTPVEQEIQRNIPVPIELRITQGYEIPKLKPKYKEVPVPIYVPRYIEVPVPAQFVNAVQGQASAMASMSAGGRAPSRMVTGMSQQQQQLAYTAGMMSDQQQIVQMLPSRRQSSPVAIPIASRMPSVQGPTPVAMSRQATGTGAPLVVA